MSTKIFGIVLNSSIEDYYPVEDFENVFFKNKSEAQKQCDWMNLKENRDIRVLGSRYSTEELKETYKDDGLVPEGEVYFTVEEAKLYETFCEESCDETTVQDEDL